MGPLEEKLTEIAALTAPECAKCRVPHSCCSPEYCEIARGYAKDVYGIDLQPTGHSRLPYMSASGCTVAPHLRPMCSVHTCEINSFGVKRGDPKWTEQYWSLRTEIDLLLYEKLSYESH